MRRVSALSTATAALAAAILAIGLASCGSGGVESGATVSVYVAAPLCAGAREELSKAVGETGAAGEVGATAAAGEVHVRAVCLRPPEAKGRLDLAVLGADARRATEDSTTIAYVEGPNPVAAKFSKPILESAGIAWTQASSGANGMRRVLKAVSESDPSQLRSEVRHRLERV